MRDFESPMIRSIPLPLLMAAALAGAPACDSMSHDQYEGEAPSELGAAGVLDRREEPWLEHLDHRPPTTKRTRSPGSTSAGGARSRSHIRTSVRPMIRQPPGRSAG